MDNFIFTVNLMNFIKSWLDSIKYERTKEEYENIKNNDLHKAKQLAEDLTIMTDKKQRNIHHGELLL